MVCREITGLNLLSLILWIISTRLISLLFNVSAGSEFIFYSYIDVYEPPNVQKMVEFDKNGLPKSVYNCWMLTSSEATSIGHKFKVF